ncbi:hypothetical protein ACIA8K_24745 [Catenuloplanes sp. NPDC051500]|uniref:hypothetical protein n=1 Tax=Catenuloplanes sp. NPDC051500 TaxID=3363959 RepID=UPI0037BC7F8A
MTMTMERLRYHIGVNMPMIHDVPDDVLESLLRQAREREEPLQIFLLAIFKRQAAFSENHELIAEIQQKFAAGTGGAGPDAPDAADVIRGERRNDDES